MQVSDVTDFSVVRKLAASSLIIMAACFCFSRSPESESQFVEVPSDETSLDVNLMGCQSGLDNQ